MLVLSADDVRKALPMRETIEAMKNAYAALSAGTAHVPLRTQLEVPPRNGLTLYMPAYVGARNDEALAVKVVSLFPDNPSLGLAFIQAAVLLLDPATGRTLALLEGSSLTAIRTGAAGGAGADLLARAESRVVAIFGAGVQGRTQLEAACAVRKIETVYVYDTNRSSALAFGDAMAGRGDIPGDLRLAESPLDAIADADLICTATTSKIPVFDDADLKPGTHISAVGAYTPDMQEIPAETVVRARVVVDSRSAALSEAGDLIQPIRAGRFAEDQIHAELGEIVLGRKSGRESEAEITLFKSVGIAVQDVMAADLAYKNALKMDLGHEVAF
jgi:ornithine cyclodeaminase/alanine dehydrogenase-like protein (mu-crystallin family)